MTRRGEESLPVSSLTFNPQLAPKPLLRSAPLPRNAERSCLQLASEDPAVNSGMKTVSLLKRHSILACNITPVASLERSILLCNDYSHASPPARSESRGVVDVQVDFTGLAVIRQGTPAYPIGQQSTDHRSILGLLLLLLLLLL